MNVNQIRQQAIKAVAYEIKNGFDVTDKYERDALLEELVNEWIASNTFHGAFCRDLYATTGELDCYEQSSRDRLAANATIDDMLRDMTKMYLIDLYQGAMLEAAFEMQAV